MAVASVPPCAETAPEQRAQAFEAALVRARDERREARAEAAPDVAALGRPHEALEALGILASDRDVAVRMSATQALSSLPWRGRLDLLAARLDDADFGIAFAAAEGLAHARDPRCLATLRDGLSERRLRFAAMECLFSMRDEAFQPTAWKTFRSLFSATFERGICALALARSGDEAARQHVLDRFGRQRSEERPMLLVHLLEAMPEAGRPPIERLAADESDYLRESAILALTRHDRAWWPKAQEAIARWSDEDPHVSAEVLLGLFELDWSRASLIAGAHAAAESELGAASRVIRLSAHLRAAHSDEVLPTCA